MIWYDMIWPSGLMMPTLSGVPSFASGPSCLSQGCRSGFFTIVEEGPPNISVLRGFVPIDSHVEQFQVLFNTIFPSFVYCKISIFPSFYCTVKYIYYISIDKGRMAKNVLIKVWISDLKKFTVYFLLFSIFNVGSMRYPIVYIYTIKIVSLYECLQPWSAVLPLFGLINKVMPATNVSLVPILVD